MKKDYGDIPCNNCGVKFSDHQALKAEVEMLRCVIGEALGELYKPQHMRRNVLSILNKAERQEVEK